MRHLCLFLCNLFTMAMISAVAIRSLDSSQYRCSFIGGKSISIPRHLIALREGQHTIHFENHEIVVDLQRQSSGVVYPNFMIPLCFSEDEKLSKIPIVELLVEVLITSASNQNEVTIKLDELKGNLITRFENNGQDEMVDWVTDSGDSLTSIPRSIIRRQNILHRGIGVLVLDSIGRIYVHQRSSLKKVFPSMYDMFVGGVSSSGEPPYETLMRELKEEIGLDFTVSTPVDTVKTLQDSTTEKSSLLRGKKNPYADKVGLGKMFENEEAFQSFMQDPRMTQKEKKNILISSTVKDVSDSVISTGNSISYLGITTIETSYNHCIVDCYAAICSPEFANSISFPDGEIEWGEWVTLTSLNSMLQEDQKVFVPDGLQVWEALPRLRYK